MKTFRFTMPQPRASAVEELNRERYVAQHKKDSPEPNLYVSGGFHFILALFFLVFGLYIYYTGLPEFGFGMYITGLITISQGFSDIAARGNTLETPLKHHRNNLRVSLRIIGNNLLVTDMLLLVRACAQSYSRSSSSATCLKTASYSLIIIIDRL